MRKFYRELALADTEINIPRVSLLPTTKSNKPTFKEIVSKYDKDILFLHPGSVEFTKLSKTMREVKVEGLENDKYSKGILGAIEGVDFRKGSAVVEGDAILDAGLVQVHYAFYLEGESLPFDTSIRKYKGRPELLFATSKAIIPCLATCIRWLCVGQQGRFLLPPSTYGDMGIYKVVPPNTWVLLLLHVVSSLDAGALERYQLLDSDSKKDLDIVRPLVTSANQVAENFYSRKMYKEAKDIYKQSLEMISGCEMTTKVASEINQLKIKISIDIATCVSEGEPKSNGEVLQYLNDASVLEDYMNNFKGLLLRGRCHLRMEQYDDAKYFLLKAHELEPDSVELGVELNILEGVLQKRKNLEVSIGKNCIRGDSLTVNDDIPKSRINLSDESRIRLEEFCRNFFQPQLVDPSSSKYTLDEIRLLEETYKRVESQAYIDYKEQICKTNKR